jgi:hypothetical protein
MGFVRREDFLDDHIVNRRNTMRRTVTKLRQFLTPVPVRVREEKYLNEATSIIDLEYRQRQIDRGLFR